MKNTTAYKDLDELDNNVRKARLEAGMKPKELAEALGIKREYLSPIELGYVSAISRDGTVKPIVFRLSEVLGWSIAELFPREICDIKRSRAQELLPEQQFGTILRESSECNFETKRLVRLLLNVLPEKRDREVIYRRFWLEETLQEVATTLNITGQSILRIEIKSLARIRHWASMSHVEDFFFGNGKITLKDEKLKEIEDHKLKPPFDLWKLDEALRVEREKTKKAQERAEERSRDMIKRVTNRAQEAEARAKALQAEQAKEKQEERLRQELDEKNALKLKKKIRLQRLAETRKQRKAASAIEIDDLAVPESGPDEGEKQTPSLLGGLTHFLRQKLFRTSSQENIGQRRS